jgi:C4-dicarboxylate-specific signal transduction histidine kinase
VGDVIGILVLTPALSVHLPRLHWPRRLELEVVGQVGATAIALWMLWGFEAELAPRLFYVLFLPLIWIAIRHSIQGATLALVGIQFGLIAGFQIAGQTSEVLELQLLMLTLVFTGLLLGASVSEWRLTEHSLRERQAQLDETLKLAAAAETASALAHELNQPLTAISSYVGASRLMLRDATANRERLERALAAAGREATRAGEVIRRLREFFRSGAKNLERVAVEDLIAASTDAMETALAVHGIALRVDCDAALGELSVDRVQIESVLHQLVQNAIDAILEQRGRREIDVRARREGDAVVIEIHDTGPGVDPALGEGVFSPFKTTKALGTGLGLAISRTIVENHGGRLTFSSSPAGATFVLTLPTADTEPEGSAAR